MEMLTFGEVFRLEQNFGGMSYIWVFSVISLFHSTVPYCSYIPKGKKQNEGKIEESSFKLIRMKQ